MIPLTKFGAKQKTSGTVCYQNTKILDNIYKFDGVYFGNVKDGEKIISVSGPHKEYEDDEYRCQCNKNDFSLSQKYCKHIYAFNLIVADYLAKGDIIDSRDKLNTYSRTHLIKLLCSMVREGSSEISWLLNHIVVKNSLKLYADYKYYNELKTINEEVDILLNIDNDNYDYDYKSKEVLDQFEKLDEELNKLFDKIRPDIENKTISKNDYNLLVNSLRQMYFAIDHEYRCGSFKAIFKLLKSSDRYDNNYIPDDDEKDDDDDEKDDGIMKMFKEMMDNEIMEQKIKTKKRICN